LNFVFIWLKLVVTGTVTPWLYGSQKYGGLIPAGNCNWYYYLHCK